MSLNSFDPKKNTKLMNQISESQKLRFRQLSAMFFCFLDHFLATGEPQHDQTIV